MAAPIPEVVRAFERLTDAERFTELERQLTPSTVDRDVLTWRAHLCTALRVADAYPIRRAEAA